MELKRCIACKEEIQKDALKCRYCHQVQTKWANLQNTSAFNFILIGLLSIFIIWIIYVIASLAIDDPIEPLFEVKSSNLHISESSKGLNIRCIGKIKNPSLERWSNFSLQAEFVNLEGNTIDVIYSEPDVTIYPSFSFKGIVSGLGSALKNEYNSCKLSVINAENF